MSVSNLYQDYLTAKEQHPRAYARDLAELLKVSEAELLHARVGQGARRMGSDACSLLTALEQVGEVKAITRNSYAVHEHLGQYHNQHLSGHAGLILNPRELDLRLFLQQWQSAFFLREETRHGLRQSLQFFDGQGEAVHKVYRTEQTDQAAWDALIERHTRADNPPLVILPKPVTQWADKVEGDQLDQEWRAMTDVHQFFPLLKKYQISRQQAFAAVGDDLAYQVNNDALRQILHLAQQDQNEIMLFVGNPGCVQIFTGTLSRVAPHEDWINIFNPRFTLHLIENAIAESWVTRKPTQQGFVTSLELFAADGTQIAQLFGQRTEGEVEQTRWREQIASLPPRSEYAA